MTTSRLATVVMAAATVAVVMTVAAAVGASAATPTAALAATTATKTAAGAAADDLPIPALLSSCWPPTIGTVSSFPYWFDVRPWGWSMRLWVCGGTAARVRVQVFTFPVGGRGGPHKRLYQAIEAPRWTGGGGSPRSASDIRVPSVDNWTVRRGCTPHVVYGEACVRDSRGAPVCVRSGEYVVEPLPPPTFRMASPIPPRTLRLAPGDTPTLTTGIVANTDVNDGNKDFFPALRGVPVIRRPDNTTRRGRAVVARGGPLVVVNTLLTDDGGASAADDKAVAYVEVSRADCTPETAAVARTDAFVNPAKAPTRTQVRAGRYLEDATVLSVSAAIRPLVTQDARLPTIVSLVYPPTAEGAPVMVSVNATNAGGGRRRIAGGGTQPTLLTYQWRLQTPSVKVLWGERGPTLRLKATCGKDRGCDKTKCYFDMEHPEVEVCNSFGCVRRRVVPLILAPPGVPPGESSGGRCMYVSSS